ncbi:MAG: tripartite tricarboxylate transporter substrate-binding protein [Rubrivivax sp.]|nr:tripartite tricarboxylate transporter substrate-binding protein [Rubrivivax sp.]
MARALTERLTLQLGQPFIVENRPGASDSIAMNLVAKADPDGYTILAHSSSGTVVPSTIPNLPFDVLKDLSGVTMLAVGSGKRASGAPEIPTTEEAGVPQTAYNFCVGVSVPSKTAARHRHETARRNRQGPELSRAEGPLRQDEH